MKKIYPLLLLCVSASASGDWVKIHGTAESPPEKFIDATAIRQSGPMNTMRRVWEISNLARDASTNVLSIKNYVEYDCKDRRVRVLEESRFSEHWAKGEDLTVTRNDTKVGDWSAIRRRSPIETIFNRVCPSG